VVFAIGLVAGVTVRSQLQWRTGAATDGSAWTGAAVTALSPAQSSSIIRANPAPTYPADLIRVIDGDTFEARVKVWPGIEVATKVRLRNIDAPELHARCADERARAEAARDALTGLLAAGGLAISQVRLDKYGGRVDATVSTGAVPDVSEALLAGGFPRRYAGGRRGAWC
jgi:endonuclease YncB( thermonuclease family)